MTAGFVSLPRLGDEALKSTAPVPFAAQGYSGRSRAYWEGRGEAQEGCVGWCHDNTHAARAWRKR